MSYIWFSITRNKRCNFGKILFSWMDVRSYVFLISGFLMVKSILKRHYDKEHAGKNAIVFVMGKFKQIALPFWISNAMMAFMQIAIYIVIIFST